MVIEYFEAKSEEMIQQKKDVFMTKDDKVEMIRSFYSAIYTANIVQFLATIASVIAIVKFMVK